MSDRPTDALERLAAMVTARLRRNPPDDGRLRESSDVDPDDDSEPYRPCATERPTRRRGPRWVRGQDSDS